MVEIFTKILPYQCCKKTLVCMMWQFSASCWRMSRKFEWTARWCRHLNKLHNLNGLPGGADIWTTYTIRMDRQLVPTSERTTQFEWTASWCRYLNDYTIWMDYQLVQTSERHIQFEWTASWCRYLNELYNLNGPPAGADIWTNYTIWMDRQVVQTSERQTQFEWTASWCRQTSERTT